MAPPRGTPRAPVGASRICVICGKIFRRPPSTISDFCSRTCRWPPNEYECVKCGAIFRIPPSRNRNQKQPVQYCSIACKMAATQDARAIPLDQSRLKTVLAYDPETGWLTWTNCRKSDIKEGTRAGYVGHKGYRMITVFNIEYSEHRVIWLWMTGRWPADQIDHKDNNKSNNAWDNLREASNSQNSMNKPRRRFVSHAPKRQYRGVQKDKHDKYIAVLGGIHVGYFQTAEEARDAYWRAAEERYGAFVNKED